MAEKGIANLEILDSGNKRLICTAFLITFDNNLKRFLNSDESVKIIKKILLSYFKSQRKELELDEKFPALFPDAF